MNTVLKKKKDNIDLYDGRNKRDIQSEYIADLFYNDESKRISLEFVPTLYFDKDGIKHYLEFSECQEVSLKDNYVITFPWNCGRMGDNILNIIKTDLRITLLITLYITIKN